MAVHREDLVRDLVRFMRGQTTAGNVADLVWLGAAAMRELDTHVAQLARQAPGEAVPTFEHGAFVSTDGWLTLALVTERGGFAFRVGPGQWGWTKPPA